MLKNDYNDIKDFFFQLIVLTNSTEILASILKYFSCCDRRKQVTKTLDISNNFSVAITSSKIMLKYLGLIILMDKVGIIMKFFPVKFCLLNDSTL
jgi:hypothetical protein